MKRAQLTTVEVFLSLGTEVSLAKEVMHVLLNPGPVSKENVSLSGKQTVSVSSGGSIGFCWHVFRPFW